MLKFKSVNKNNFEDFIELDAGKEGEKHCAKSSYTIIEAVFDKSLDKVKGIYLDDTLAGMFHYYLIDNKKDTIWINRFMIDKKHQGKGIGKKSIIKLLKYIKKNYKDVKRIECSISQPIILNHKDKLGFVKMNNARSRKFYNKHKEYIYYLDL